MSIEAGRLRGLSPAEQRLWRRYRLSIGLPDGTQSMFNVRLGEGSPAPDQVEDNMRADWKALTQRRADVILLFPDGGIALYEIKPRASLGAIGQLRAYATLIVAELRRPVTRMLLLCGQSDPETTSLIEVEGIEVLLDPGE